MAKRHYDVKTTGGYPLDEVVSAFQKTSAHGVPKSSGRPLCLASQPAQLSQIEVVITI